MSEYRTRYIRRVDDGALPTTREPNPRRRKKWPNRREEKRNVYIYHGFIALDCLIVEHEAIWIL